MKLGECPSCAGFVPLEADACPHCRRASPGVSQASGDPARGLACSPWLRIASGLVATVAGGGVAMTLMACYGQPPCKDKVDKDHDGYSVCLGSGRMNEPEDCNDSDPSIHPTAPDPSGDGIDQNCDGVDGTRTSPTTAASTQASASTSSVVLEPSASSASSARAPQSSASASASPGASSPPSAHSPR